MVGNVVNPQHSWADLSETEENMEIADIPSYAQMVGRRRQSSFDYIGGMLNVLLTQRRILSIG